MNRRLGLLWIVFMVMIGLSGCASPVNQAGSTSNEQQYDDYFHHVTAIWKTGSINGFKPAARDGDLPGKVFTTFPDRQQLDPRKHDGADGDPEKPSRYLFYYTNTDETVLVRLNLIYCPEFQHTRIIALHNNDDPVISEKSKQNLNKSTDAGCLIAFHGGIAEVDTQLTAAGYQRMKPEERQRAVIDGQKRFLKGIEPLLLRFNP